MGGLKIGDAVKNESRTDQKREECMEWRLAPEKAETSKAKKYGKRTWGSHGTLKSNNLPCRHRGKQKGV